MKLSKINTQPRDPDYEFRFEGRSLGFRLIDFWQWNQSDLVENRTRGILAEFIVRQALEITHPTRIEWDAFDLITQDGIKIEIKSAAYIQSWNQTDYSKISFNIKQTKVGDSSEQKRPADVYIFCLLQHKDQLTIDPMNLDQWLFYLVARYDIDCKLRSQRSLRISTLTKMPHIECTYNRLKDSFERMKGTISQQSSS